jgi:hypothetical protein
MLLASVAWVDAMVSTKQLDFSIKEKVKSRQDFRLRLLRKTPCVP